MRRLAAGFIFILGLVWIAAALFAESLGLDNDPGWGQGRIFLFTGGWLGVLTGLTLVFLPHIRPQCRRAEAAALRWLALLQKTAGYRRFRLCCQKVYALPFLSSRERRGRFALTVSIFFSLAAVWWYATAGTLTGWFPYPHTYFDRLAQAFRHGQLSLLDRPDASLTSLADPYPFENRQNARYLWDVSYYQGRFYLYWGPTPALILAGVKSVARGVIEDQALVVGFLLGMVTLLSWIGYRLWQIAPSPLKTRWLLIFLPALSLNLYLLWPTGRPGVYEAAILSGQFFLLAGVAALIEAFSRPPTAWGWFLAAGAALGLAIGSRPTLLISAFWLLALAVWRNRLRFGGQARSFFTASAAFALPLLVSLGLLMAYNAARFGSPLESGLSYQLGIPGYPPDRSWVFSTRYLLPNLYHYLLRPAVWRAEFPYVFAPFIPETNWPWFIRLPEHYTAHESQTGWLSVFPLLVILPAGAILLGGWLRPFLSRRRFSRLWKTDPLPLQGWLLLALLGSGLAQTAALLLYFFPSMRFQIEIVPLLSLSAWLTFLWLQEKLAERRWLRPLLTALMAALACYGLVVGLLGAFAAGEELFEAHNPLLFRQIAGWFERPGGR
ncbi:MAG: hypothetical protein ACK4SN_09220 [Bellilinea sp.]